MYYETIKIALIFTLSLCLIFTNIPLIYSQENITYGEIRSTGTVLIQSSTGKWTQIPQVYPLLNNTNIKTQDGIVKIITRIGSHIDLSKDTLADINAKEQDFEINLKTGTISFIVNPSETLKIITKDVDISISNQITGYYSMVAGPAAPRVAGIQGMVSVTEKGTLIRSIDGKMNIMQNGKQVRLLNTGETYFASAEGSPSVFGATGTSKSLILSGIIAGVFVTGATVLAFDAFRGDHHHVESPSGF